MRSHSVLLLILSLCLGLGFGVLVGLGLGRSTPVGSCAQPSFPKGSERSQSVASPEATVDHPPFPSETTTDETIRKLRAQISTLEEENRVLNERNRELTLELNRLHQEIAKRNTEQPVARVSPIGMQTNVTVKPSISRHTFTISKGLGKQLADEIGLSEQQLAAANAAIQRAWERVKALELANAEIRQVSENEVAIKVNPFPGEAAQTRESLRNELRQILSLDQYREFEEKVGQQLNSPLAGFGEVSRDITIRVETATDDGKKCYRITETSKSPGTGTPGEATSVVSLGFGGASGGAAALGPVVVQSVSSETTGGGRVTQIKTMYVSEIPPEYRHLVPSNTY